MYMYWAAVFTRYKKTEENNGLWRCVHHKCSTVVVAANAKIMSFIYRVVHMDTVLTYGLVRSCRCTNLVMLFTPFVSH